MGLGSRKFASHESFHSGFKNSLQTNYVPSFSAAKLMYMLYEQLKNIHWNVAVDNAFFVSLHQPVSAPRLK